MPEQLAVAVAEELTKLLKDRGWSVNALAKAAGLPQATLAKRLRGVGTLDLDDIDASCRALGLDVKDLISWSQR